MGKEKLQKNNVELFNSTEAVELFNTENLYSTEENIFRDYFQKRGTTLDLGCGTGRTTINLYKRGFKVVGVDIAENMIERARKVYPEIDFKVMSAEKLDYPDNSFDNILFSFNGVDYLHPKSKRIKTLEEIRRVLKPGGIFAFSSHNSRLIPNSPGRIKNWLKNFTNILTFSDYYIDYQPYGGHLTYWASPASQVRDLKNIDLEVLAILSRYSNNPKFIQFVDPWPYYVVRKND